MGCMEAAPWDAWRLLRGTVDRAARAVCRAGELSGLQYDYSQSNQVLAFRGLQVRGAREH